MDIFLKNTKIDNYTIKKEIVMHLDPIIVITEDINLLDKNCETLHKLLISYKNNYDIYEKINEVYNNKCSKRNDQIILSKII
jgi:hypothetical protein